MKINWKIRFSKNNMLFNIRFVGALLVPVLAYLNINWEDFNTWSALWGAIVQFASNPFLIGLTIVNAIMMVPDPTTKGINDSNRALEYQKPGGEE